MKWILKKLKYLIFPVLAALLLTGCENANQINAASFSEITAAGSEDYAMTVKFMEDKRVEDKYFDIQLMTDVDDVQLVFWQEGEAKITTTISQKGRWRSLTTLKVNSAGLEDTESFLKLKEAVDQSYMFNVNKPVKLIFRVVAGEAAPNSAGKGQILANTEPVSKDFVLECKK